MHTADGTFIGYIGSSIDITEHKAAQAQRDWLLVESLKDYAISICWLTPGGEVASWNAGAERLLGYHAKEILGEHISRFFSRRDRRRQTTAVACDRDCQRPSCRCGLASAQGRLSILGRR